MKQTAVIVDLDGTLCNIEHRRHHLENNDWETFFSLMHEDTVNDWCADLIWAVHEELGAKILFVTGRSEKHRNTTKKWIKKHVDIYPRFELHMRRDDDFRKDALVKREIYETKIKDRFNVSFVIDDRQQVVDEWRALGLVCLQCAKGDY